MRAGPSRRSRSGLPNWAISRCAVAPITASSPPGEIGGGGGGGRRRRRGLRRNAGGERQGGQSREQKTTHHALPVAAARESRKGRRHKPARRAAATGRRNARSSLRAQRSNPDSHFAMDCFVAPLLAMTMRTIPNAGFADAAALPPRLSGPRLDAARAFFYGGVLGCPEGRHSAIRRWPAATTTTTTYCSRRARTTSSRRRSSTVCAVSSGRRARPRWYAVRARAAPLCTDRRGAPAAAGVQLRALEGHLNEEMARQFNRWSGIPHLRPSLLERNGAGTTTSAFPAFWDDVQVAPLEPVGLRRRARCRPVVPAGALTPTSTAPRCSSSRRRHRDEPAQRRADGRGVSGRRAAATASASSRVRSRRRAGQLGRCGALASCLTTTYC